MKNKDSISIITLESIDYVSYNTGLNHFLIPERTDFISLKQVVSYATQQVPQDAVFSTAHIRSDKFDGDILLKKVLTDGSVQTFQFGSEN